MYIVAGRDAYKMIFILRFRSSRRIHEFRKRSNYTGDNFVLLLNIIRFHMHGNHICWARLHPSRPAGSRSSCVLPGSQSGALCIVVVCSIFAVIVVPRSPHKVQCCSFCRLPLSLELSMISNCLSGAVTKGHITEGRVGILR